MKNEAELGELVNNVASAVGSLTNPTKIVNTFATVKNVKKGSRRYYIQSAYKMDSDEKRRQECLSLLKVDDSFKKIVIVADDQLVHHDDHGIATICLRDFLTQPSALDS